MFPENKEVLKELEGLKLIAYPDPKKELANKCYANGISIYNNEYRKLDGWEFYNGKPWTIGYGHTSGVKPGDVITQQQAEKYLDADIKEALNLVNIFSLYWKDKTDNQKDAFTIFAYQNHH